MRSNERGMTFLEVTVASAIGVLILALALKYLHVSLREQRGSTVSTAILPYEESVRTIVFKAIRPFLRSLVWGQPVGPPACANMVSFSNPYKCSEHELDQCLSRALPMGYSIQLVRSNDPNPAVPGTATYAHFNNCLQDSTFGPQSQAHHGAKVIRLCLRLLPSNTQPKLGARSDLLTMQPLLVELAYFNFFAAPTSAAGYTFPTGAGTPNAPPHFNTPDVMSLQELGKCYPTGLMTLADPPPPILNYLYYTFYWTSQESGKAIERHYSNFLVMGNGNG